MSPSSGPSGPQAADYDFARAERFYSRLRRRITAWLDEHTDVSPQVRERLLLLPDLFALLLRLIGDPRVDGDLKVQLILVSAYVISPLDLVPDFLLPLGLMDDTVALALMISRLARIMAEPGEEILREHWEGEGDVLERVHRIAATADEIVNRQILDRLRWMISHRGGGRHPGGHGSP